MPRSQFQTGLIVAIWLALSLPIAVALGRGGSYAIGLAVVLLIVPIALMLRRQMALEHEVSEARGGLDEQATQLALAERLAGMGRMSFHYPGPEVRWSAEFCALAGLPERTDPSPEVLAALLPDGLGPITTTLDGHRDDTDAFTVEFDIRHPDRGERILRAQARNQFAAGGGRDQVLLVLRDVTAEYARLAEAEAQKAAAMAQAEEALRLARTDPLTGLSNRRAAMNEIDRALLAARRDGAGLGLLVFDIDFFKRVNDTHGHLVGDDVLRLVARTAEAAMAADACLARIGGEEFLAIMPGADTARAATASEALRQAVEHATAGHETPPVTISVGWAVLQAGDTGLGLFARADAALLEAKREGRNRVRAAA